MPIKQVPDMAKVKFDSEKGKIDRSSAGAEINPFDLNALETAVQIKDKLGGKIITISMGPPQAESALRDALSQGADEAVLLVDRAFAGADTLATSYTLAAAIRKLGRVDLIVCGEKTVDGDTGQVGPEIAEHLNIPHVAYVTRLEEVTEKKLVLLCDMQAERYLMGAGFPVLITVTKDINSPRLPSLRDKLNARQAKIDVWGADELSSVADKDLFGSRGSATSVRKVTIPSEEGRKGRIFKDNLDEAVRELVGELEKAGVIK